MEVRLLGAVAVTVDGVVAPISGRQERGVLAALALRWPHAVSCEQLIADIWDNDPPASARNSLQVRISAIRKAADPRAIETVGAGYRLGDAAIIDAKVVGDEIRLGADQLGAGDPATAVATLDRTLARWQGEPLADVPNTSFAAGQRARLEELRSQAVETRLTALLDAGRPHLVGSEAEALVRTHPLREGLWSVLIRARYALGRQADALAAYAEARERLAGELGVDPGPELQDLHGRILAHTEQIPRSAATIAAQTTSPGRADLPVLTTTIGRADTVASIVDLLGRTRLVTLHGAGGIGKSHLAIAVARTIATRDDVDVDDVVFMRLADVVAADDVPAVVCETLGIADGSDPPGAIVRAVQDRALLIVWDNFEHVLSARALVATLLQSAPRVRHLVTSRRPLNLAEETRFGVPPLTIDQDATAEALFVHQARRFDPGWQLLADERSVVRRMLQRCGGLPLAIELAASQLRVLSVVELAEQLDVSVQILRTSTIDRPERHQTMEASVGWSLDRLEPALVDLMLALATFRGGFTLPGAAAVAEMDVPTVLPLVEDLVDRSLVLRHPSTGTTTRFSIHEPVRDVVTRRAEPTSLRRVRDGHAAWIASRFGGAARYQMNSVTGVRAAAIAADRANIRQAMRWLIDAGKHPPAADLLLGILESWYYIGVVGELTRWFRAVRDQESLSVQQRQDLALLGRFLAIFTLEQPEDETDEPDDPTRAAWAANLNVWTLFRWPVDGVLAGVEWETAHAAAHAAIAAVPDDRPLELSGLRLHALRADLEGADADALYQHEIHLEEALDLPFAALTTTINWAECLLDRDDPKAALQLLSAHAARWPVLAADSVALRSQRGLALFATGDTVAGQSETTAALRRAIDGGNPLDTQDCVARLASMLSDDLPELAAEARAVQAFSGSVRPVRRRLDELADRLGPVADRAEQRWRDRDSAAGVIGAARRWLADVDTALAKLCGSV